MECGIHHSAGSTIVFLFDRWTNESFCICPSGATDVASQEIRQPSLSCVTLKNSHSFLCCLIAVGKTEVGGSGPLFFFPCLSIASLDFLLFIFVVCLPHFVLFS